MTGILVMVFTVLSFQNGFANCIRGNCYDGKGTFVYPSGAKYVGQFQKGKINGEGILYFSNGNKYIGNWIDHYREGEGKMIFTNGDEYTGNFRKSTFHGEGTMKFSNKDKYVGMWREDKQNGQGTYFYNNGDRYEGNFQAGMINGKGKMFYKDGSKYIGIWKDNYKDGNGVFYKTNGTATSGIWVNGKFMPANGQESIIPNNQVANQNTSGQTVTDMEAKSDVRNCNDTYCADGSGSFTYADGSKFIGEFNNGYPAGYGTCYYANGDKYTGQWANHTPHGMGTMVFHSGQILEAVWERGKPQHGVEPDDSMIESEVIKVDRNREVKIWAVVVGVARYSHMPVLKYTDDDAYQIYAFLKSPEGGALPDNQIKVLVDEDATRSNILRTMRRTFLQADENDVVVLYFSGHGLQGSFLPVDFDGFNNKLDHEDVKKIFGQTKAKHKLCLADACHSGSLMAARNGSVPSTLTNYYKAFQKSKGGTALLLSSKGDEYSLEDHGLRQGIFSHFLIKGLKGEADKNRNNIISIQELYNFVHTKVRAYTGNVQSPTLTGDFDPDMPVAAVRR